MKSEGREPHVAVVGAGFSGTLLALHLARRGARVSLIERRGRFAAGAAYSTQEPWHLLNVRAGNMSALADDPAHFAHWFGNTDGFAARRDYGRYLAELLDGADGVTLVEGEVTALREEQGVRLTIDNREMACDAAVLASGNLPPLPPGIIAEARLEGDRFVADPWSRDGAAVIGRLALQNGAILLLGSGLTGVDMALSLAGRGFGGDLLLLSRRGLVPRAHEAFAPAPLPAMPEGGLLDLVRATRRRAEQVGWRAAVDALRPYTIALWQRASLAERRAFLRHLRPWWDVHRHRIAPQIAQRLAQIGPERIAGRLRAVEATADGVDLAIAPRGGGPLLRRSVAAIVNCTGPAGDIARTPDPLIRRLFADGLARPDPLGLGIDVAEDCRLPGTANLYAVGPLTKGAFWEMVAVPDIRVQVEKVAARIASG